MIDQQESEVVVEPERYEFFEKPRYHFDLDRRDFVKLLGGGIVVCLALDQVVTGQQPGGGRGRGGGAAPQELGAWLHIGEDGRITVYTGKTEVGQNIRTSLSQVVADELRLTDVSAIRLVMADTQLVPYDGGTVGSRTTPDMAARLRRVAATTRELLIDLASEQLGAPRETLNVAGGKVSHAATSRELDFDALARGQKLTNMVASDAPVTAAKDWKIAGTSVGKVDGRAIVTGTHRYASDISRPGMMFGKMLRPDRIGAKLESADLKQAEAIEGVTVVRDADFVGVVAPTQHLASRALETIHAQWQASSLASSDEFLAEMKKSYEANSGADARPSFSQGSLESGLAEADKQLRATYTIAYIAHAPLEPRAAVAEWTDGKLTVWTGTQRPFGVRDELVGAFRLSPDQVRVIVPDTGSGYGGKHNVEAAIEAARLAKAAGRPVKLVWTREEEFTWAYFRPAGVIGVVGGVKNNGTLTAWDFHNYNSGSSSIRTLYDVPHQRIAFHTVRSPLRQGSYRGLAATANHFARESHMDDLARAVGSEPLEFRMKNLREPRLRAVLEAAAKQFQWSSEKPNADRGFGIAGGSEKGSFVATCAEVAIDRARGSVKVVRLVTAFECGAIVNPDHLKNQVEGAGVMALGGALFEAIQLADGKIVNPRFSRYRVPKFSDVPKLETVLLDRKDLPSVGAGETPIVTIAPAIANAIYQASGIRLDSLPMATDKLRA